MIRISVCTLENVRSLVQIGDRSIGAACPKCASQNVKIRNLEIDGPSIRGDAACLVCNHIWSLVG
jgi:hypothetical protein